MCRCPCVCLSFKQPGMRITVFDGTSRTNRQAGRIHPAFIVGGDSGSVASTLCVIRKKYMYMNNKIDNGDTMMEGITLIKLIIEQQQTKIEKLYATTTVIISKKKKQRMWIPDGAERRKTNENGDSTSGLGPFCTFRIGSEFRLLSGRRKNVGKGGYLWA